MDTVSTRQPQSLGVLDPRSAQPLSATEVPYLLEELGLLTLAEVVCPGIQIVETFGRNLCFRVAREGHSGLFIKQPLVFSQLSLNAIDREARVTRYLTHVRRNLLPALLGRDPRSASLVYELIDGQTLMAMRQSSSGDVLQAYGDLGAALSALHAIPIHADLPDAELPPLLQAERWRDQNPETATAMALLAREGSLRAATERLCSDWQTNTLIHSDLKPNNVIVQPNGSATLIDWETGGLGDPRWDLGMCIGYLVSDMAYDHIREEEHGPLSEALSVAKQLAKSFLGGYAAAGGDDRLRSDGEGVATFAGISIAQFVLALGRRTRKPTRTMVQLTQLALNIVRKPNEALTVIFGYK